MAGVPLVVAVRGVAGAGSLLESTVCVATTGDLVGSDFSCPSMLLTSLTTFDTGSVRLGRPFIFQYKKINCQLKIINLKVTYQEPVKR